jgi:hypothetical protein
MAAQARLTLAELEEAAPEEAAALPGTSGAARLRLLGKVARSPGSGRGLEAAPEEALALSPDGSERLAPGVLSKLASLEVLAESLLSGSDARARSARGQALRCEAVRGDALRSRIAELESSQVRLQAECRGLREALPEREVEAQRLEARAMATLGAVSERLAKAEAAAEARAEELERERSERALAGAAALERVTRDAQALRLLAQTVAEERRASAELRAALDDLRAGSASAQRDSQQSRKACRRLESQLAESDAARASAEEALRRERAVVRELRATLQAVTRQQRQNVDKAKAALSRSRALESGGAE